MTAELLEQCNMPKRARCPYCDRLLSRDEMDGHVQRCRQKASVKASTRADSRKLVVDGNNVAFYLSTDGQPHVRNLILAQSSLARAGFRPVFVVSAALIHKIDKPEALREFISQVQAIRAPRGTDDDLKIIKTAQDMNADVVSNDRFLNWIDKYPWLPERVRTYRMTPSGLILQRRG
jgi:hypothetical protein